MKRIVKTAAALALAISMTTATYAMSIPGVSLPSQSVEITFKGGDMNVMGKTIKLSDAEKPFTQDGTLMLPFRKLAETFGLSVSWSEKKVVTVSAGDVAYAFSIGQTKADLGSGEFKIIPPILKNDRTFIAAPLLEAAGIKIKSE